MYYGISIIISSVIISIKKYWMINAYHVCVQLGIYSVSMDSNIFF